MSDRVQVWSMCEWFDFINTGMCEWSGFYNAGMYECYFGQCASGPILTTPKCVSASLVNVRVVRFVQHRNVRVLVWSMCEWSGCNVRMEMCV